MALLRDFRYHTPSTLYEALGILMKAQEPLLLGGGTFVLNHLKKSPKYPTDVIGLKKIPSLRGIKVSGEGLSIGAMTTIAELVESELIQKNFSSLFQASRHLGTTPIRHMATIGGNIASRFFWVDLPAVLISLGAKVCLSTFNSEETMTVEEFLNKKPAKKFVLTALLFPKKDLVAHYFRHTKTMDVDVPSLAFAFCASLEKKRLSNVKLIVNTTVSLPVELKVTEALFDGKDLKRIIFSEAKGAIKNDMGKAKLDEYRMHCLEVDLENLINLLKR